MKCKKCESTLSFAPAFAEMVCCDEKSADVVVECPECGTSHQIAYGGGSLVNWYDEKE